MADLVFKKNSYMYVLEHVLSHLSAWARTPRPTSRGRPPRGCGGRNVSAVSHVLKARSSPLTAKQPRRDGWGLSVALPTSPPTSQFLAAAVRAVGGVQRTRRVSHRPHSPQAGKRIVTMSRGLSKHKQASREFSESDVFGKAGKADDIERSSNFMFDKGGGLRDSPASGSITAAGPVGLKSKYDGGANPDGPGPRLESGRIGTWVRDSLSSQISSALPCRIKPFLHNSYTCHRAAMPPFNPPLPWAQSAEDRGAG